MRRVTAVMKRDMTRPKTNLIIKSGEKVTLEPMAKESFKARPLNRHWAESLYIIISKEDADIMSAESEE